jgi:hypothetical protein
MINPRDPKIIKTKNAVAASTNTIPINRTISSAESAIAFTSTPRTPIEIMDIPFVRAYKVSCWDFD